MIRFLMLIYVACSPTVGLALKIQYSFMEVSSGSAFASVDGFHRLIWMAFVFHEVLEFVIVSYLSECAYVNIFFFAVLCLLQEF